MPSLKRIVAKSAVSFVDNDMIVGVGSGSTVREFIKELSKADLRIKCVPTSHDTELLLLRHGIGIVSPLGVDHIDLAVDGADSIVLNKKVILKGGGGALTREKIVDYVASKLVIIADYSKLNRIFPIVVEIIPCAYSLIYNRLSQIGRPELRMGRSKLGPTITDNGNWLVDIHIDMKFVSKELEMEINSIPGVVENGIFHRDAYVLIARREGFVEEIKI